MREQFPKDDFSIIIDGNAKEIIKWLVSKGFDKNYNIGVGENNWFYCINKNKTIIYYSPRNYTSKTYTLKQLKELDMQKEIIGYKLIKPEYLEAIKEIIPVTAIVSKDDLFLVKRFPDSIKNLKEAGVLDIWFEPVYKEEAPELPIIEGYGGKLEGNYIKYGCASFNIGNLKRLYDALKCFNIQDKHIHSFVLDKGEKVTGIQLQQIIGYLDYHKL